MQKSSFRTVWFCHGSAIENIIYSQTQYFDCSLMVSLFNYRVSYVVLCWLIRISMYVRSRTFLISYRTTFVGFAGRISNGFDFRNSHIDVYVSKWNSQNPMKFPKDWVFVFLAYDRNTAQRNKCKRPRLGNNTSSGFLSGIDHRFFE